MISAVSNQGAATTVISDNAMLDESDFIMLLITQLSNQDPLDPLDDREFISQMAQLNTLNETVALNENMRTLQMLQAASLVGREVEAIGPNGEHAEGTVTEVWFIDSQPWLTIDDEVVVALEQVIRIT